MLEEYERWELAEVRLGILKAHRIMLIRRCYNFSRRLEHFLRPLVEF